MSELTITLAGSEEKAEFSGSNAWLRNDGTDTVYAAKSAGVTAGADGVVAVPAGQSAPVYGANGTVFLLGTGSVQLIGSDYSTNPFKTSAQSGGSGADSVARAAISAHAGNTDIHVTAAEKAIWNDKADLNQTLRNLTFWSEGDIKDKSLASASGFVFVGNEVTGMPYDNTYWFASIEHTTNHCKITATDINNHRKTFNIVYSDTLKKWDEWINIADGGNADTLNGLHANEIASNPNLLINPDFRINQRGETSYTAAGYTVDGWYTNGGAVDVTENGVELTNSGTSAVRFRQNSEITHAQLAGRDITLSAGVGGTTYSASGKVPETKPANDIQIVSLAPADTDVGIYLNYSPTRDMFYTYAYVPAGKSAVLNWVKAEIGSVATLFVPPDPATELAKCQRYLTVLPSGRYGRAVFVGTNAMQFECDLPVTMRIKPTVVSGTFGTIALNQSSTSQAVTDYTTEILSLKNNLLLLQLSKTNGASDCALFATDKILLSAEL